MSKKKAKKITENDLKNTYFIPMTRMHEVIDLIDAPREKNTSCKCSYNIMDLKRERSHRPYYCDHYERYSHSRHRSLFVSTCYKALYAHDWDKLLYILKKVPKWKFEDLEVFHYRVLTILLMYHPDSKANGYFNEYLHMVWGCRADSDKKAILKIVLTLCKKMYSSVHLQKYRFKTLEERRQAFEAVAATLNDRNAMSID